MHLLDPLKLELEKNALIEASAGTGKTYTITTLLTRLVAQGFTIDSILVVTFTDAAAAELKYRIRQRLASALSFLEKSEELKENVNTGDREEDGLYVEDELYLYLQQGSKEETAKRKSRIRQAIICFDEAAIMTIHSFCFRILRENAFETGALFDVKLIPDTKSIVREIVLDFMAAEINDLDPFFLKFLKKKNFKASNLVSFFTRFMSRSGVKVIPDPEHVKFCDVSCDYIKTCCRLLKILEIDKEKIKEIFLNHPGVNRRSYSKKSVEKWLETAKKDLLKFHVSIYMKNSAHQYDSLYFDDRQSGQNQISLMAVNNIKEEYAGRIEEYAGHIFNMTEKGDSLYKFTNSRLREKNKTGSPVPRHIFFDLCEKLLEISCTFEKNITALKIKFFLFMAKELEIKKERLGICFFDDIVNALAHALKSKNAEMLVNRIREKFSSVLIDEFQDTDQRQYSIFSAVFSGTNAPFFMIGDPKQAIYSFRGGDIFAYLRAVEDAKGRAYTLEKNWRSDPLLVRAVNSIFMRSDNPFLFNEIKFNPVITPDASENRFMKSGELCPPFQFLFIPGKAGEQDKKGFIKKDWLKKNIPLMISDDIASLLNSDASIKITNDEQNFKPDSSDITFSDNTSMPENTAMPASVALNHSIRCSKKLVPGDIAILVRTNTQAENIKQALSLAGIPSYISKTGSVFDSNEAIETADLLAAVLEPENSGFMGAALCGGLFGLSYMDVFILNSDQSDRSYHPDHPNSSDNSDNSDHPGNLNKISFVQWHENFKKWKILWEKNGIIRMLQDIFYSENAMSMRANPDERSLTNYYHLAELLHRAEREKHLSPLALYKWFLNQLVPDMREEYSDELRLETDAGAVNIVTIHKSKGMEYPVVYLPYLWEDVTHGERDDNPVFHNPDDKNKETLDLGSETIDESRRHAVFEEQAENMRILYVGLTRAASMCRIIWGNFKSIQKSSLFKLIHGENDSSEELMLKDIHELAEQSCRAISIDFYEEIENHKLYEDKKAENEAPVCRTFPLEIVQEWMFTSFSRLVSGYNPESFPVHVPELPLNNEKISNEKISLIDFPRGPIPGELIHSVFEYIDFMADTSLIKEIISSKLVQYGFEPLKWTEPLANAFPEILATPLYNKETEINDHVKQINFSLKDINKNQRLNEMEFIFSFKPFSKQMLADIFRNHMNKNTASLYADRILDIGFDGIRGFMKGFIDLVFKFKGKWYIVDYKSNFLGDTYSDYSHSAMLSSMMEHHYFLQYHLYVTAIHRYLGFRVKDYNYNSHFGGVFYLFVRGMHPDYGSDFGVFYDRPDYEMVKKLSELF